MGNCAGFDFATHNRLNYTEPIELLKCGYNTIFVCEIFVDSFFASDSARKICIVV
ncbi:hypothetical protein HD598_001635 [Neomicrococcus aestuarii]|uniref:Uncharacterized protein n=1 Tax=Neomicrococcus aestuarii TaxID=556325 RepID=A0A7W8TUB1_9MICC|nr:hypothetical protein [Neomicrococcus aestuarii]